MVSQMSMERTLPQYFRNLGFEEWFAWKDDGYNEGWWCILCEKYADDNHLGGQKHQHKVWEWCSKNDFDVYAANRGIRRRPFNYHTNWDGTPKQGGALPTLTWTLTQSSQASQASQGCPREPPPPPRAPAPAPAPAAPAVPTPGAPSMPTPVAPSMPTPVAPAMPTAPHGPTVWHGSSSSSQTASQASQAQGPQFSMDPVVLWERIVRLERMVDELNNKVAILAAELRDVQ